MAATLFQPLSGAAEPYSPVEPFNQPWRITSFLESARADGYHQFDVTFASPVTPEDYATVWIGTSNGLLQYDGFDWTHHTASQGALPSDMIRSVFVARDGRLWIGSDKGTGIYDGISYQTLGSESGLAGPNVRRIVEDPDGTLWFCSDAWPNASVSGGVTSYRNGAWHAYGIEDGLPSSYVANYFRDSSGRQFAATRSGVAQFDGERWNLSLSVDPNSQNFTSASFAESPTLGVLLSDGENIYRFENNEWRGEGCILVVDDEDAVRELACAMIEMMGFSPLSATDGLQRVAMFRERVNKIRLVLSDLTMPHLDGREFVRQIEAVRSGVPTVMMSGFNENLNSADTGFFIQKPFTVESLQSVIQKACGNKLS